MVSRRSVAACAVAALLMGLAQSPAHGSHAVPDAHAATHRVTHLKVTSVRTTSVSLAWKNPSGPGFTGTQVRYAVGKRAPATRSSGTLAATLPKKRHSLRVTGLARDTTYSFSVFAKTRSGYSKPVKVTARTSNRLLTGVEKVVTNSNEACALLRVHRVDCWGYNAANNLGGGSTLAFTTAPVHVRAVGGKGRLRGVLDLVTDGNSGFCALTSDDRLTCWGDNSQGSLGQGDTKPNTYPVVVKDVDGRGSLGHVTQVVGGYFGYCALQGTGSVVCWGNNLYGALGTGSASSMSPLPVDVVGVDATGRLGNVARLTRSGTITCAILTSANLVCWGPRYVEALGAPTGHQTGVPFRIPGIGGNGDLDGVRSVALLGDTICAVLDTTGAVCWGRNSFGVLGAGSDVAQVTTPVEVHGVGDVGKLTDVAQIVGSGDFACARFTDGRAACWGASARGQISGPIPPGLQSAAPRAVVGLDGDGVLSGVKELTVNVDAVCAVLDSTQVACWGSNKEGQLGTGSQAMGEGCDVYCSLAPAYARSIGGSGPLTGVTDLTSDSVNKVGGYGLYAVLEDGGVDFWGAGTNATGLFGTFAFQDFAAFSVPSAA